MTGFPRWVWLLLLPLAFAIYFLVLSLYDPTIPKIDLSQTILEFLGLVALGLAIYEFRARQEKPKLEIWALSGTLRNGDLLNPNIIRYSQIESDAEKTAASGHFDLYLINKGKVPAQFVKMTLKCTGTKPERHFLIQRTADVENVSMNTRLHFDQHISAIGNGDFVVHSLPMDQIPELVNKELAGILGTWIGRYNINAHFHKSSFDGSELYLEASLQALGSPLTTSTLRFVPSDGADE